MLEALDSCEAFLFSGTGARPEMLVDSNGNSCGEMTVTVDPAA